MNVNSTTTTTKILVKNGLIQKVPSLIKKLQLGRSFAIITDSKVKKRYGGKLLWALRKAGFQAEIFSFPEGEKSKNLQTVEKLIDAMIEKSFNRSSTIIALGGGVVGDIAGLTASMFMRGISIIQIPTTLLAMTDSSIGGKTGVNSAHGKNLLGTFHPPIAIFIDPSLLKTLAPKHLKNGLAEAIKYGVIKSKPLFLFIEKNLDKILKLDKPSLQKLIKTCVKIKTEIVKKDPSEKGLRMILNYGHTFGHALEKSSNYTLLHGFAVSLGMVLANQKAVEKDLLSKHDSVCIKNLLKKAGLPVYTMHKPTLQDLIHDKKVSLNQQGQPGNQVTFILPTKIGKVIIHKEKVA